MLDATREKTSTNLNRYFGLDESSKKSPLCSVKIRLQRINCILSIYIHYPYLHISTIHNIIHITLYKQRFRETEEGCVCVRWTAITVHILPFRSWDYGNFWGRSPQASPWPRRATSSIFWWRTRDILMQRISLAIQRGNAASILCTISPNSKWHLHNLIQYFLPCFNLCFWVEVISNWCTVLFKCNPCVPILWTRF
jgi:hypothetical protein